MDDKILNTIIEKPSGFWNWIFPWTKANKLYKKRLEQEVYLNSTHIERMYGRMGKVIKGMGHNIGLLATLFFTLSFLIVPLFSNGGTIDGVYHSHIINGHIDSGARLWNTFGAVGNGERLSYVDHIWMTLCPTLGWGGLTGLSKINKSAKYVVGSVPALLVSPYLLYKYFTKKEKNPGIKWHRANCDNCKKHSNKITIIRNPEKKEFN